MLFDNCPDVVYVSDMGKARTVSEILRDSIQRHESTPAEIARATGVDKGRLSRFIRGQRSLTLPAVDALAKYLGLELATKQRRARR